MDTVERASIQATLRLAELRKARAMSDRHDIIIRNGTIVNGSGNAPFVGDVAIQGGRISAVGIVSGSADEEIEAAGLLVTPGFVDIHTHYDGQVIWDSRLAPSSGHGVTTVVMGNCGVGFAPCRAQDRERLTKLMEGVEDIPGVVLTEGLTWEWETYPEYLDAVQARPHDINIASLLPHSALRVYVMGERAVAGEVATPDDLARMAEVTTEAMNAGAIGFGTSRTIYHRSSTGDVVPTLDASEEELMAIARAIEAAGDGILQIANDYKDATDIAGEFALMVRVTKATGRSLTMPTTQSHSRTDEWRTIMRLVEQANEQGVPVKAQFIPRGIGMLFGLELSMHPFSLSPAYLALMHLPLAGRLERMRDPGVRAQLLAETPEDTSVPMFTFIRCFDRMFEFGDPLDYEPPLEASIEARAAALGIDPLELAYDLLLKHEGHAAFYAPLSNYGYGNLDPGYELLQHKDFVLGLGDGGAHLGTICDASYSTFMLTHWTRDRKRGPKIGLAQAIRALTSVTAETVGLLDRGLLAPGYNADVNIIDYDQLTLHAPKVAFDLPAGGRRLTQEADGYVATIVNGIVVYRGGRATGALPGELVRGRRALPQAAELGLAQAN
jgi:N-acyl-D-amino-acid deacylase